jgi:hypothetical protein
MKLDDFPVVETLVDSRAAIIQRRDHGRIEIVIDGHHQDQDLRDRVKPAIDAVLNRRIEEIDQQLQEFGVQVA